MKKILFFILVVNLFAFEGAVVKSLGKVFSKDMIEIVGKKYGNKGVEALEKLSATYGKNAFKKLEEISAKYGPKGIELFNKFGNIAIKDNITFKMVSKYKDKAVYLLRKYPQSEKYFAKYGDLFMNVADNYGNKRVIKFLDEAAKRNEGKKVLEFIQKGGVKAVEFIERNWGKILVSGFVLLNSDKIIDSSTTVANHSVDIVKEMVINSDLLNLIGIGVFIYILSFAIPGFIRRMKR
jgi:hypothetical protein